MGCSTVEVIVPITQPGSSSSLSLPCTVPASSSSSPFSPLSEPAKSVRQFPITTSIASNVFSGSLDVNRVISACVISSCSSWTAASASSTRLLAPAVSHSTESSIHLCFSWLPRKCVSRRFSTASFYFDLELRNAQSARTVSASKPLLPLFTWRGRWVDCFVDLPYLQAESREMFLFGALTIVVCVYFVVGRDVGCCMLWTIWAQAASFMSRLVRLLNLNKAQSTSWLSINQE